MKKWYYAIFLVCLFVFNQAFKSYVEVYGLIEDNVFGEVSYFYLDRFGIRPIITIDKQYF